MSSLPFLTSELQALSKEAGRRHADVKEVRAKSSILAKVPVLSPCCGSFRPPTRRWHCSNRRRRLHCQTCMRVSQVYDMQFVWYSLTWTGFLSIDSAGKQPVLLAPIVLGCSTKNPKVTSIAVSGLQRLTGVRGAITEVQSLHIKSSRTRQR